MSRYCLLLASVPFLLLACDDPSEASDAGPEVDANTDAGGMVDDAGPLVDGGPPPDGATPGDAGSDAGGAVACAGGRPAISGITQGEGLVIARDGTIYFSQPGSVGRLLPGGSPETSWVRVGPAGGTIWGMTLDAANQSLYVGSPMTGAVHRIDVTAASPTATTFVSGAGGPNGLVLGPDGALYFSDFSGGQVYRVVLGGATGSAERVTTSMIRSANGLAFMPDGRLLVASYGRGEILALVLEAGVETSRTTFATVGMGATVDGLALDADGRVYVTYNGRLVRLEADGTAPMTLLMGISSAANIDFGAGALDCEDIYVAAGSSMQRYEMGTSRGAPVPWH